MEHARIRKVALIGARGTLGSAILRCLLLHANDTDKSHVVDGFEEITILTRPESRHFYGPDDDDTTKIKAIVVPVHYDNPDELVRALKGQDAVICASGIAGISQQTLIIDACVAAGVKRYITNDFANPPEHLGLPEMRFALVAKQEIREHAQRRSQQQQQDQANLSTTTGKTDNEHSSVPFTWTAVATGHFLDYALRRFSMAFGFDIPHRRARLVDDGLEPFSATTVDDIARAVVVGVLLRTPLSLTANRHLVVRTLETTQAELLRAFEELTNTKWEVERVESSELYATAKKLIHDHHHAGGNRPVSDTGTIPPPREAMLTLLPVQIFERGAGRSSLPKDRYDNALLGLKERSVREVVAEVLQVGNEM